MAKALTCPSCGGPLPHPKDSLLVLCDFCGTTCDLRGPRPTPTKKGERGRLDVRALGNTFIEAMKGAMGEGESFLDVTRRVTEQELDAGSVEAVVNVVGHLVYDFEAESGVAIHGDPIPVGRIVEAYFKVCEELAREGATEINLPFITATPKGPLHFMRAVTAETFAELASTTPVPPEDRAPEPETGNDEPEPKPKKKGFFSKLFGG